MTPVLEESLVLSEKKLREEVDQLDAWRNRMRATVVHLKDAEYDEESGEPLNRAAEIESALVVALDEIDQAVVTLQRITESY